MPTKKPANAAAKSNAAAHLVPTLTPAASAPELDKINKNRGLRPVTAAVLPALPSGFLATPFEERRARLRLVPETQRAELLAALREVYGRKGSVKTELGEFAPEVSHAAALAERTEVLQSTLQALRALVVCHEELEDIALSDGLMLLEKLHEEFAHRKTKLPDLAGKYPHLQTLFEQRSSLIAEGIARKKEQSPKPEKP